MRGEIHTCNGGEPCLKCHNEGQHGTCYNEPCEDFKCRQPENHASRETSEACENPAHAVSTEEKNAASREREKNLARRVVLAQNDLMDKAFSTFK